VIAVPLHPRRWRPERRPVLYAYTAAEIVAGSLVLAWAILTHPIGPAISLTGPDQPAALVAGVAFWSAFCLIGGTRVGSIHGYGVLTFHMPFILAASALGGPAAGGVVAFVGTIELRELRDPPVYGLLANHAALALAGVVAGLMMSVVRTWLAAAGVGGDPAMLVAFMAGAAGFVLVSVSLAAGTAMIRDESAAIAAYANAFRATMLTEVAVGLLLALLYGRIGPWASILGGIVVLQLVRLLGEREFRVRDVDTPVLVTPDELRRRTVTASQLWPIGILVVVIEGWRSFVDECGREAGERLAGAIGEAIAHALFARDAAARTGDGEWRILLVNTKLEGAIRAARKYRDAVQRELDSVRCPDGRRPTGGLKVVIAGGIADDADRGGSQAVSRAEQALFHALRDGYALVVRTESGSFHWDR
jgi:GGDEF domain-containing protein